MLPVLPEEIIELILSYAPNFRDNLKKCQMEILDQHRPIYLKKVIAGFTPGIADSPTWHNFIYNRNDEIRIWRRYYNNGPMMYTKLKLHSIEITEERTSAAEREGHWHTRDIILYYGWTKLSNTNLWKMICEWNSGHFRGEFTPGYY